MTDRFIEVSGIRRPPNLDHASTMARDPSFFTAVETWLLDQPGKSASSTARARRPVSDNLARATLNRIRRVDAAATGWQPPSWRARNKRTGRSRPVAAAFHDRGIAGLIERNERLILAHTHGDRLRLRATLAFLNARLDDSFSTSCYGGRPDASARGTDRQAALLRFHSLVRDEGMPWAAKVDISNFFDAIPHAPLLAALKDRVKDQGCVRELAGYLDWYWKQRWPGHKTSPGNTMGVPQGSPVSSALANLYLSAFDQAMEDAGVTFFRYLDDVTLVARSPETLAKHLALAMQHLESLAMQLQPTKTQVAWLGSGEPPSTHVTLPGRGMEVQVDREFDVLGIHFLDAERFHVRPTTINRLLRRVRWAIARGRGHKHNVSRYKSACRRINQLLGYEITDGPEATCRIGTFRYVQPRQHAVLGHSPLILEQLQQVDRTIRKWLNREFGDVRASLAKASPEGPTQNQPWRVRSAARMYEMEVKKRSR